MTVQEFVRLLNENILFPLIALMTAVAILVFLWGCFQYMRGADNEEERSQGARHILWGLVGLLVMASAFTILQIAAKTFYLDDELKESSPSYLQ